MCCVPDVALKAIGPAQPIPGKTLEGIQQATPAGRSVGDAIQQQARCVSMCAVRCVHNHLPGMVRGPVKMREEDAKKWLLCKERKDFARFR